MTSSLLLKDCISLMTCRLGMPGISGCSGRLKSFSANKTPSALANGLSATSTFGHQPASGKDLAGLLLGPWKRYLYTSRRFFFVINMLGKLALGPGAPVLYHPLQVLGVPAQSLGSDYDQRVQKLLAGQ